MIVSDEGVLQCQWMISYLKAPDEDSGMLCVNDRILWEIPFSPSMQTVNWTFCYALKAGAKYL